MGRSEGHLLQNHAPRLHLLRPSPMLSQSFHLKGPWSHLLLCCALRPTLCPAPGPRGRADALQAACLGSFPALGLVLPIWGQEETEVGSPCPPATVHCQLWSSACSHSFRCLSLEATAFFAGSLTPALVLVASPFTQHFSIVPSNDLCFPVRL